jgi:hypothetical protein
VLKEEDSFKFVAIFSCVANTNVPDIWKGLKYWCSLLQSDIENCDPEFHAISGIGNEDA